MAQDLLAGKTIPVFFYGQQYGFTFFEVLAVALGILFFGSSVWALKFGSLLVFSIGLGFLFRLLIKKGITWWWAVLAIMLISMFPAWMVWATKARGGYVTAFSACCMLFYIIQTKPNRLTWIMISGFIMAIAAHSQLFIAISVGLLWLKWVATKPKIQTLFLAALSFGLFMGLLKLPAFINEGYWSVQFAAHYQSNVFFNYIKDFYKVALGYFYYEMVFKPRIESIWFGGAYYFLAGLMAIIVFFKATTTIKLQILLLAISAAISFAFIMCMRIPSYRYMFGCFTAILFILVLLFMEALKTRKVHKYLLVAMLPAAFVFSATTRHIPDAWMLPESNDAQLYNQLLTELDKKGIKHVFSTDPLLQWQLNYNGVCSRYTSKTERTPYFLDEVNKCYQHSGCKTAVVGYKGFYNGMEWAKNWGKDMWMVNDKYFIYQNPEQDFLLKAGFEF